MKSASRRRYVIGIGALLAVVVLWVGSSFLMNDIFSDYNKPFAITYMNTASFSLYLIFLFICRRRPADRQSIIEFNHALYDTASRSSQESLNDSSSYSHTLAHVHNYSSEPTIDDDTHLLYASPSTSSERQTFLDPHDVLMSVQSRQNHLSTRETAKLSLTFCALWFAANWSSNASLAYTTVASSTILASMSGFFTLCIGSLVGIERFTISKLVAVSTSLIGIILISSTDRSDDDDDNDNSFEQAAPPRSRILGDFLALIGAFFYGCYTVLLKLRIKDESRVNMPLFFGFVGLFNTFILWPLFLLLDAAGIEEFALPSSANFWIMIMVNALLGTFASDYFWLLSMLMTSPLVVTLGLSLTIPLAIFGDVFVKGIVMAGSYWLGALMVFIGFVGVNIVAVREVETQRRGVAVVE
ncbi:619_t:CDS:2 [Paraglomus brasilianum]|uniref:619_t:CDS:1 n=1 Tax=Paraglomus brasilianum TaxID=144538 RepID=A0A9N9GJZ9_9GLOM|nr:619_t:CDS:2 [Paraglomus brasilianum]